MWSKTSCVRFAASIGLILCLAPATAAAQASSKVEEAAALSTVAAAKAKAGKYKLCADMFVQAYKLDPSYLGYLYSAARCSQKAGDRDGAEQGYRAFLARAPAEHPLRSRATDHLAEIVKKRESEPSPTKTEDAKKTEDPGKTQPKSNPLLPQKKPMPTLVKAGWGALAAGTVLSGIGVAVLLSTRSERSEFEAQITPDKQSDLIGAMSHSQAVARADELTAGQFVGFTLTGLGVVGAIGGTFLVLTDERHSTPAVTLVPSLSGLSFRAQF